MATTSRNKNSKPTETSKVARDDVYGEREDGALSGNLTRDPELRFTPSGRAVASCSVASSERVKNEETGQWEDGETEFFRVNLWGTLAENVAEYLSKGDRVTGTGYFQEHTWNSPDGEKQSDQEFTATDFGPSLLWNGAKIVKAVRSTK